MKNILTINKPISITPLQAIHALQKLRPELEDQKIGYAGRLDPMAEGLLLLLIGDENKKRKEYERLDKEYEFDVLLGLETDSYDGLGMISGMMNAECIMKNETCDIPTLLASFVGKHDQSYPPYSAARVNGKPLFYWARAGKIDEVTIPQKKITIDRLQLVEIKHIAFSDFLPEIIRRIENVNGKFRQTEIIERWNDFYKKSPDLIFPQLTCSISCSSGTYVRSIANEIGQKLGTGAIATRIKRTRVGEFTLQSPSVDLEG